MLSDVVGQTQGVSYLRYVVDGKFTSPLLLVGQEGVGRRFSVTQAVKEMFCLQSLSVDCRCPSCSQIDAGVHPDYKIVYPPDGKDLGVDTMRDVVEQAMTFPSQARYRVILIDGVDRMTMAASNAILKVLEEPLPR